MRKWAGVMLLLVFTSKSYTGGFALSGVGIRALQLGGAARAIAGDPSGIYWNPAGLAFSQQKEIQAYMSVVMPEARIKPNTGLVGYDGGYSNRQDIYAEAKTFYIPGFLMSYPINTFSIGLGVFVPFGLGTSWDLYDYPIGWQNPIPFPENDWESDLQVMSTYISLSTKLSDNLAIGVSGGMNFGRVSLNKVDLFPADSTDPGSVPLPFSYLPVTADMTGKGTGYGFNAGILYRVSDQLNLGLSARYYSTIPLEGTTDLSIYFPDSSEVGAWKLSSSAKTTADFPLPYSIGFGFAYKSAPNLTFLADVDYTFWSVIDVITLKMDGNDFFGNPLHDEVLAKNWENTVRLSFGIDYAYSEDIGVRFGVYYDQSPIPEASQDPLIPDIGGKLSFNGGISYEHDFGEAKASIYLGGEYLSAPDRVVLGFQDVNNDGKVDNFPGSYSMQVGAINFGVNLSF